MLNEGELDANLVVKDYLTTALDGKKYEGAAQLFREGYKLYPF